MYIKKRFSHRKEKRDLLIGQLYKRSNTSVASRAYTYDTLGRPMTRSTSKDGSTVNDSFGYNSRSELNTATVNNEAYAYDYDNIGNRETAQEAAEAATSYESNQLNQYTAIGDFEPTYDDAGNQTKVKTSTGIWTVVYNAENRPTSFTNADSGTIVECTYDYMGRRATKKVTVNGAVTLHHRYLYRGYLQIACCDLTRAAHPCLWLITWDPSQATATRPLAIQKDATWYTYGWDLTKNICEVFSNAGFIKTTYNYTPYGAVTAEGSVTQSIQWSSEFSDGELGLVYYNYRHYNSAVGRWLGRDSTSIMHLYPFLINRPLLGSDYLGLVPADWMLMSSITDVKSIMFSDFKGTPPLAFVAGGMDAEAKWHWNTTGGIVRYKKGITANSCCVSLPQIIVSTYFKSNASWYRGGLPSGRESKLLRHEQVHVEMARRGAGELQNQLRIFELCEEKNEGESYGVFISRLEKAFVQELKVLIQAKALEIDLLSDRYDEETIHSLNEAKQDEYNLRYGI